MDYNLALRCKIRRSPGPAKSHANIFINQIHKMYKMKAIIYRIVPVIIWANYCEEMDKCMQKK